MHFSETHASRKYISVHSARPFQEAILQCSNPCAKDSLFHRVVFGQPPDPAGTGPGAEAAADAAVRLTTYSYSSPSSSCREIAFCGQRLSQTPQSRQAPQEAQPAAQEVVSSKRGEPRVVVFEPHPLRVDGGNLIIGRPPCPWRRSSIARAATRPDSDRLGEEAQTHGVADGVDLAGRSSETARRRR